MTQQNSLNVELSNFYLNRLKSGTKNEIQTVLRLPSNIIGNSNDETNFLHKLLSTSKQVAKLHKAFANNLSVNIELSETGLPLMKDVIKPLAKSVLVPLGLKAAALQMLEYIKKSLNLDLQQQ